MNENDINRSLGRIEGGIEGINKHLDKINGRIDDQQKNLDSTKNEISLIKGKAVGFGASAGIFMSIIIEYIRYSFFNNK